MHSHIRPSSRAHDILTDIDPMLLGHAKAPFTAPGWIYVLKYDGYRILTGLVDHDVALKARNGADATSGFPEVVAGLATISGRVRAYRFR